MRILIVSIFCWLYASPASAILLYRVSALSDITLPNWSIGDGAVTAYEDICVYSTLVGTYAITVSSPGGFALVNGAYQIPYSLSWNSGGAGNLSGAGTMLANNVTLASLTHLNVLAPDCSTGTPSGANARLSITITQAAMTAAYAGTYSGTLTLVLSPI